MPAHSRIDVDAVRWNDNLQCGKDNSLGVCDSLNLKFLGLKFSSAMCQLQSFACAFQLTRTIMPRKPRVCQR